MRLVEYERSSQNCRAHDANRHENRETQRSHGDSVRLPEKQTIDWLSLVRLLKNPFPRRQRTHVGFAVEISYLKRPISETAVLRLFFRSSLKADRETSGLELHKLRQFGSSFLTEGVFH